MRRVLLLVLITFLGSVPGPVVAQELIQSNGPSVWVYTSFQSIPTSCGPRLNGIPFTLHFKRRSTGEDVYYDDVTRGDCGWYEAKMNDHLLPGLYAVRVKPKKSLAKCLFDQYLVDAETLAFTGFRGGDADNNNVIDVSDFNIVKQEFGMTPSHSGWTGRADFDNNNLVDSVDFVIMRSNFGLYGCLPLT